MEEEQNDRSCFDHDLFQRLLPYIATISARIAYAGFNIITKSALDRGMSHYTLVVYGNAIGVAATAVFAVALERKGRPKITMPIVANIFILGLLGPVINRNLYYVGMQYTTSAFASAINNLLPPMTFVIAVLCRLEKVEIRKIGGQAKVAGTLVSVSGAILMTLYKGPAVLSMAHEHFHASANDQGTVDKKWIKGSIFLIVQTLANAFYYIMQATTVKKYAAPFSLTTLVNLFATFQGALVTVIMERKTSAWIIGWNIKLLATLYSGIVISGVGTYGLLLAMQKRGPVFVAAFSPLSTVIVAIMGLFIIGETLYVGGIVGAVLIVVGLYIVLWGTERDYKKSTGGLVGNSTNIDNGNQRKGG